MALVDLREGVIESNGVVFVGKEDRFRLRRAPFQLLVERDGEHGGMYEFNYSNREVRDAMYKRISEAAYYQVSNPK